MFSLTLTPLVRTSAVGMPKAVYWNNGLRGEGEVVDKKQCIAFPTGRWIEGLHTIILERASGASPHGFEAACSISTRQA
ncbi:hypothetical protein BN874_640027 [Candidatus Contendobacter odensis Run_B_J11]|uniref:Uncharacterized protein n=1 Tax=Candidatus Contendobacter odensis Run_B_J11 TaxID=1400861 RepID=A0A7U7GEQ7_9GAMM|nr:hypothetical protein BN874_640027 [Candidatus Contendobacter odensis Run_B_J11]